MLPRSPVMLYKKGKKVYVLISFFFSVVDFASYINYISRLVIGNMGHCDITELWRFNLKWNC